MGCMIGRLGELAAGATKKFVLTCEGGEIEGFLLCLDGVHHAYVNRCRHVPMALDWVDNQFFTADGCWLQCATHGAYYEPATGECIAGPPCGKALVRIPLHIDGDAILAECPGLLPDDA
jgi:nitrite reductase/ring-hydroxylating ferredoxin subunit